METLKCHQWNARRAQLLLEKWCPITNPTALVAHVKYSMVMPYRPTPPLERWWPITNPEVLAAHVEILLDADTSLTSSSSSTCASSSTACASIEAEATCTDASTTSTAGRAKSEENRKPECKHKQESARYTQRQCMFCGDVISPYTTTIGKAMSNYKPYGFSCLC